MSKSKETGEKSGKSKKNTSLRLDGKTLNSLKNLAIEGGGSVQNTIKILVNEYLETPKEGRS